MSGAAIFGVSGGELTDWEAKFFQDVDPWGFILFARNVETPDQVRRLTSALRDAVGREAPIFIDQEGGRVARMQAPHWRVWPPALDQVLSLPLTAARDSMYLRARMIAHELRAVGIDGNCTPLGDIAQNDTHPIIFNRCYGEDVNTVTAVGRAVAEGCLDGGVLPVLKHIPGQGRADLDSHLELPRVDATRTHLDQKDFATFRALADLPLGMTAHVVFDAIDPEHCATLSSDCLSLVRQEIGFDGLLMTDDISMRALSGPMDQRCRAALAAGCDLILHCNGEPTEMLAVAEAAGRLADTASKRAQAALVMRKAPKAFDLAEAEAAYQEFSGAHV
ncbi:MAG: glycoside hydrolase family 3 N-terminal domain-containing protein [Pseudomonadota bacterium]